MRACEGVRRVAPGEGEGECCAARPHGWSGAVRTARSHCNQAPAACASDAEVKVCECGPSSRPLCELARKDVKNNVRVSKSKHGRGEGRWGDGVRLGFMTTVERARMRRGADTAWAGAREAVKWSCRASRQVRGGWGGWVRTCPSRWPLRLPRQGRQQTTPLLSPTRQARPPTRSHVNRGEHKHWGTISSRIVIMSHPEDSLDISDSDSPATPSPKRRRASSSPAFVRPLDFDLPEQP